MKQISILLLFLFLLFTTKAQSFIFGTITGENGQPIDNLVISNINTQERVFTTSDGKYKFEIPAEISTQILFHHISFTDSILTLKLSANEQRQLDITLRPIGKVLEQVVISAEHQDGYERIDPKLSFKMPSPTNGVEGLLKSFQGVSSTNELSSQYNVRGGNYDENLIFVNGIQIYSPFLVRSGNQEGCWSAIP